MADEQLDGIRVNDRVVIPRDELLARASRAGGAGGQHVNTSSTRIELLWNVGTTRAMDDGQRERVLQGAGQHHACAEIAHRGLPKR